jgi:nucleotide-binding universal stress UspA family protein
MSAYTDGLGFRSHEVLVITDLAPASTNAVWRAALIAREQGASLRLLYVGGERRCMTQMHAALEEIRKQVHARLGIAVNAEVWEGDLLPKAISAARSAGLLVIGPRRSNPLREWIAGTQTERLIRLCRIPTLVVKRRHRDAKGPLGIERAHQIFRCTRARRRLRHCVRACRQLRADQRAGDRRGAGCHRKTPAWSAGQFHPRGRDAARTCGQPRGRTGHAEHGSSGLRSGGHAAAVLVRSDALRQLM